MHKKNNIYYKVCLRNFLFFNIIVLFSIGISISIFLALENKILAAIIAVILLTPLVIKAFYSIHHLFKYSNLDLTHSEEITLDKVYEVKENIAVFNFMYGGKLHYTRPIFSIKGNGDYTVEKYKEKKLIAMYSKKYNEVFLFTK